MYIPTYLTALSLSENLHFAYAYAMLCSPSYVSSWWVRGPRLCGVGEDIYGIDIEECAGGCGKEGKAVEWRSGWEMKEIGR